MRILALESSCDETAAAIVASGNHVMSSQVYSQIETHKVFGGVVPEVAAREHLKVIDGIVKATLQEAEMSLADIDAIAVTQGPGLVGALLVAISYAKGLASAGKPLIPVNHVHAHVHGALLGLPEEFNHYPALALVVSGGHTNLYRMASATSFELVAHSIDDACGESFDKVAKLLGLGYPGGPKVEELATSGDPSRYVMPVMMAEKARLEFSYSGLKTHIVNLLRQSTEQLNQQAKADICAAFQEAALDQLVRKMKFACEQQAPRAIVIAGGVAANQRFRSLLTAATPTPCYFPKLAYCSDNAAMIAALAYYQYQESPCQYQQEQHSWDAFSRYALGSRRVE